MRGHLNCYLSLGKEKWSQYVRIVNPSSDIQLLVFQRILSVYLYLCEVAIDLVSPVILLFLCCWVDVALRSAPLYGPILSDPIVRIFGPRFLAEISSFLIWWLTTFISLTSLICAVGEFKRHKYVET